MDISGRERQSTQTSAFLALTLIIVTLFIAKSAIAVDYRQQENIVKLLEQTMQLHGVPAAAITLVENGKLSWSHTIGWSNVEHNVKADSNTRFRSGSLIKPMTATAALQLANRGDLNLDAPVTQYCKEFPDKKWPVTTRHLLSHTAGIRSYNMPWKVFEAELYSGKKYKSVNDALTIFKDDPLIFKPGSDHKYTSYGYNLIGCVIEGAAKTDFISYLRNNIFIPANMSKTVLDIPEEVIPGRATGYKRSKRGKLMHEKYTDLSNKIPSAGLVTTARDIARFALAYMNGDLLPKADRDLAMTATTLDDSSKIGYGLGWEVSTSTNDFLEKHVYHGGVTPGVSSIMSLYPESTSAIILMMNMNNVPGREALANDIRNIVLGL